MVRTLRTEAFDGFMATEIVQPVRQTTTGEDRMTPRELAEKILKTFNPAKPPEWLLKEIESLLAEALAEEFERMMKAKTLVALVSQDELKEAKAAAYDECAVIVDEHFLFWVDSFQRGKMKNALQPGDEIRQRAKEVLKPHHGTGSGCHCAACEAGL